MMTPGPLFTMPKEGTTHLPLPMTSHHTEVSLSQALIQERPMPSHLHPTLASHLHPILASPLDPTLASLEGTHSQVLSQAWGTHPLGCLPCPSSYPQPCPAQVSFVFIHHLTFSFLMCVFGIFIWCNPLMQLRGSLLHVEHNMDKDCESWITACTDVGGVNGLNRLRVVLLVLPGGHQVE